MKYEVKKTDSGLMIKDILKRRMNFSTRLIRKLKLEGGVKLNREESRLNTAVRTGDVIEVSFPEEKSRFEPQNIPLDIVFEDDGLMIINKQPGIVVHPTKGHPDGTLANALTYIMEERNEFFKIRFVNRLDMDTSGLLIVAKNAFSQESLQQQMKESVTVKKYIAVVDGVMDSEQGVIDLPIGIIDAGTVGRAVTPDGYPSLTRYKVLKIMDSSRTLVELTLETGRTHQIRVHMSHIGFPVTGDSLYGRAQPELIPRQALHARYLAFNHPVTGERTEVWAEIPDDIKRICGNI